MTESALTFAVVVPAHQAASEISRCLAGLRAAGFAPADTLVVDDGSRDGTSEAARAAGVRVLRNEAPVRPARARNAGTAATASDVVVFVDADVVVHPGVQDRIATFFRAHPGHVAVFGSYDDAPASPEAVSRYRNLLHHWVHQRSQPEAQTFWTGLGAVRRQAFEAAGGFNPAWESIEDVELGLRLTAAGGRIRLDRGLLGTHLKGWTLPAMVRTDWVGRAVPWTRLLLQRRTTTGDLNLAWTDRASAALVAMLALSLPLGAVFVGFAWIAAACALGFLALNARFLAFLAERGGLWFAVRSAAFHAVHHLAAIGGYFEARVLEGRKER